MRASTGSSATHDQKMAPKREWPEDPLSGNEEVKILSRTVEDHTEVTDMTELCADDEHSLRSQCEDETLFFLKKKTQRSN